MKLVTFEVATPVGRFRRIGDMHDDTIVDLTSALALQLQDERGHPQAQRMAAALVPPDMIEFLEQGDESLDAARAALAFVAGRGASTGLEGVDGARVVWTRDQVRLLSPLPRPRTLRDFSIYYTHAAALRPDGKRPREWFERPSCYKGNPETVVGPDDDILWPRYTEQLDLELEIGAVVGRKGHDISADEGDAYVVGYTIYVDCSARDVQWKDALGPSKGKDFCTVLGPCIVTTDEFDYRNARAWYKVDGETWWEGNTGEPRSFMTNHLVAWASQEETLYPGELIGSGTIGTQCSLDTEKWIKPGQTVELGIEGIGTLTHKVVRTPGDVGPVGVDAGMTGEMRFEDQP